jgi:hypothetical protein
LYIIALSRTTAQLILSIKIQDGGLKNGDRQCGQFSLRANSTDKIP